MRYAVSLTSIPPRFDRLGPVLTSLLAQTPAPDFVFLALPRQFRRFACVVQPPELPVGVDFLWADIDHGPATKALVAARVLAGQDIRLIYCDDDWLYGQGWAAALLGDDPDIAVTGQTWDIARIGRQGNGSDIAQGFSGVSVRPEWLCDTDVSPPDIAWSVDDIWLSGHLARQGIQVAQSPTARATMRVAFRDAHALQDHAFQYMSRDAANRATAAFLHDHYDIWPQLDASNTA
ncbi:hypothetical protein [Roseovarius phycicola]|uniref:Glycosyl transferase family 2 n=1 Tax=Roseovarius phycicola TaxID=3080976 RepID=A0ABZ2HJS2_9RHOB